MGRLTAIVLGSAAGGAFPQWNCRCPVCALAWAGDARVRARTQAGIAVSAGDGRWTLINASPDLGAADSRDARAASARRAARQPDRRGGAHRRRDRSDRRPVVAAREHAVHALRDAGEPRGGRRQCHVRRALRDDAARGQSGRAFHAGGRHRGEPVHGARQAAALSRRRRSRDRRRERRQCRHRIAARGRAARLRAGRRGGDARHARALRARRRRAVRRHAVHRRRDAAQRNRAENRPPHGPHADRRRGRFTCRRSAGLPRGAFSSISTTPIRS